MGRWANFSIGGLSGLAASRTSTRSRREPSSASAHTLIDPCLIYLLNTNRRPVVVSFRKNFSQALRILNACLRSKTRAGRRVSAHEEERPSSRQAVMTNVT